MSAATAHNIKVLKQLLKDMEEGRCTNSPERRKQVKEWIAAKERYHDGTDAPKTEIEYFMCSSCGREALLKDRRSNQAICPDCGGVMDILTPKERPVNSFTVAHDNLDIEEMDSTAWMML